MNNPAPEMGWTRSQEQSIESFIRMIMVSEDEKDAAQVKLLQTMLLSSTSLDGICVEERGSGTSSELHIPESAFEDMLALFRKKSESSNNENTGDKRRSQRTEVAPGDDSSELDEEELTAEDGMGDGVLAAMMMTAPSTRPSGEGGDESTHLWRDLARNVAFDNFISAEDEFEDAVDATRSLQGDNERQESPRLETAAGTQSNDEDDDVPCGGGGGGDVISDQPTAPNTNGEECIYSPSQRDDDDDKEESDDIDDDGDFVPLPDETPVAVKKREGVLESSSPSGLSASSKHIITANDAMLKELRDIVTECTDEVEPFSLDADFDYESNVLGVSRRL